MELKFGDKIILNNGETGQFCFKSTELNPIIKTKKNYYEVINNTIYTYSPAFCERGFKTNLKIIKIERKKNENK